MSQPPRLINLPNDCLREISTFLSEPSEALSLFLTCKWTYETLVEPGPLSCANVVFKINKNRIPKLLQARNVKYPFVKRISVYHSSSIQAFQKAVKKFPYLSSIEITDMCNSTQTNLEFYQLFSRPPGAGIGDYDRLDELDFQHCAKFVQACANVKTVTEFHIRQNPLQKLMTLDNLRKFGKNVSVLSLCVAGGKYLEEFPYGVVQVLKKLRRLNLVICDDSVLRNVKWDRLKLEKSGVKELSIVSGMGRHRVPLLFDDRTILFLTKHSERVEYRICYCQRKCKFDDLVFAVQVTKDKGRYVRCRKSCPGFEALKTTRTSFVFVKTLSGLTYALKCDLGEKVEATMQRITAASGIPVDQQRLVWAGKQLELAKTLQSYNVSKGDVIHLVLRMRGGKPVILLYPDKELSDVTVSMEINQKYWSFSTYYPKIKGVNCTNLEKTNVLQWKAESVKPNGMIKIGKRSYPSLFWEALTNEELFFDFEKDEPLYGVPRDECSDVLHEMLKAKGMKDRDCYDLITYWLSELEEKEFVLMQLMSKEKYAKLAKLIVEPNNVFTHRVVIFLLFCPMDSIDGLKDVLTEGDVDKFKKEIVPEKGVLVEWGGMKLVKNRFQVPCE